MAAVSPKKFNMQVISAETGEETPVNWVGLQAVLAQVREMHEGDELVIQRCEDVQDGAL